MRFLILAIGLIFVSACVSNESVREAVKKDPKIVFDAIEEHPEEFMEVVNRAAKLAQQKNYERQVSEARHAEDRDLREPKKPELNSARRLTGDDGDKIVIVEYADFQCPACRMAYESIRKLKEKYKVQFYFKNMPLDFHKMAYPAAQYFEAIRLQDRAKASRFYEYVFENQRQLQDDGFLNTAAKRVGADMKRLETDLKSDKVKKLIADDMNEFQKFGFTGTPVIIVNGVAMNGAQPVEELVRMVEKTKR